MGLAVFEEGIKAYRKRKTENFEREIFLDGTKLIVSLVVVLATWGAGAGEVAESAY